jgi:hypothetical protein
MLWLLRTCMWEFSVFNPWYSHPIILCKRNFVLKKWGGTNPFVPQPPLPNQKRGGMCPPPPPSQPVLWGSQRMWPVSRGCSLLHNTWSYLRICRRFVLPYTQFCNCLLDYDYVLHIVNFAILYLNTDMTDAIIKIFLFDVLLTFYFITC